ncbi:translocation/assembly module TamB domain-containing protein [Nodosilinea sp. P-1105]|uniref:translocation/assembly module TamB domain-containing protein n=1 Tax=Nodosilinea sp. P-1105 TaxID=2546229 RepID=UPI00146BA592|nr:translocation/assembly module TamB domain-containing protein [Nodosilinea sp. P-1105]NMF83568.1 hypothetical protein [Nodosilinea sp. P-1105]
MSPSQEPESERQPRQGRPWLTLGLMAGSVLLIVGAGTGWRGWVFARRHLTPWLSAQLSETLNRPVELGDLEHIGFTRVRVGPSQIPPTATDPDTVSLNAIEVRFNPLNLWRRELRLDVVLEQADIYLEQSASRDWVEVEIDLPDPDERLDQWVDIRPGRISIRDSSLTLVPYQPSAAYPEQVAIADVQGQLRFRDIRVAPSAETAQSLPAQQIDLTLRGESLQAGSVELQGAVLFPGDPDADGPNDNADALGWLAGFGPDTFGPAVAWAQPHDDAPRPQTQLNLRAQEVRATDIMPIVDSFLANPLVVQFPTGLVSGNVDMAFGGVPFTITGTARVDEGTVVPPGLPEPLENLQGDVRFRGREFEFEDVTATLGDLSARAEGTLSLDTGYDLTGQVTSFTLAQMADLFNLEVPVATAGDFIADVVMTGALSRPRVVTDVASQGIVTIDQVAFVDVGGKGTFERPSLVFDGFRAIPQAGGSITGTGQFTFGTPGHLSLSLTGDRLPADALGQPYGLPDTLTLGPLFVQADVSGPLQQLTGQASWRAPAGTYPARGDLRLADDVLRFTNTFVQVAGGTVAAEGVLANRQWQADLRGQGLQLAQLGAGVAGEVNGNAQLSGTLADLSLAGIQGQGTAQVALAGGTVASQANLAGGRWTADVRGDGLQMAAFSPNFQGTGGGNFRFSGTTDNLTVAGVRGQGQLVLSDGLATAAPINPQLSLLQEPLAADLAWDGQAVVVQQASTAGIRADGVITPRLSGPGAPAIANLDLNLLADRVNLATLPVPLGIPVQGVGSFAGRLTGRPGTLALSGYSTLAGLAVSDLAFASPLTGPVDYSQVAGVNVDLQGGGDRIWVTTQRGDRDLEFLVRGGDALAQGYTQGADYFARLENLPLDGLNLPPGGQEGLGTVSGTVTEATLAGNWQTPTLRASFDIEDPGFGYIQLQTAEVETAPPGQPEILETQYGNLRGTVIYADDVVSLIGVGLESASGSSRYLASGTYALNTQQLNGELVVDNGQINDILTTLKIFELADFRPNLLQPPEWFRRPTPEEFATLTTTKVGDREASLLDQLRRLAEVLELQDALVAQAEAAPLPPLEELRGRFSGTVVASGAVPQDLTVDVDLAGRNWLWGDPTQPNGTVYRIDDIVARGTYADDVIQVSPVSLRSRFLRNGAGPGGEPLADVALAELNGAISLDPETLSPSTLRLNVSNVPVHGVRHALRLPDNLDGLINVGASLTGPLRNPQIRGLLTVDEATINRNPVEQIASSFNYQDARLNLIGSMTLADQTRPLRLDASLPYQLPGVQERPASDRLNVRLQVEDEGFSLVNLLTQAFAWESGQGELDLALTGRWPIDQPFQDALASIQVRGGASFDNVTLTANALPGPLTNVRGDIQVVEAPPDSPDNSVYVNGLVLDVQNLRGDFSNGEVVAQGNLKLLPSIEDILPGLLDNGTPTAFSADDLIDISVDRPFELTLDNIALNLRNPAGNYQGRVDGEITVAGSLFLLEPLLQGEIRLSNGVLTLPETNGDGPAPVTPVATAPPTIYQPLPPVFEDFQLTLANNVRLAIPGFVDVRAEGSLDLVGSGTDVRPDGRINLPSGQINLLTTNFRLTGDENYAEFDALDETIDPYLVANLSAVVADSSGGSGTLAVATPFPRIEISDAELNQLGLTQSGVQTIRIRARVDGRASRVVTQLQGVELTSTPPRSEGQIVSLISGGLLTALESTLGSVSGGGDSFQGLIAFAGSALLANLQSLLDASLDNVELRLFSASPPSSQGASELDVGGEVGFNISPAISVSVQKVFTNITPAVFNVRYRINDRMTLRGTTSFEQFNENTGAILEFQF